MKPYLVSFWVLIGALLEQNTSLGTTTVPQANERHLNRIALENTLWEQSQLAATDLNLLQVIAAQCPLSGGFSVFQARNILKGLDKGQNWGNTVVCSPIVANRNSEGDVTHESMQIVIYPNPANQSFTISGFASDGMNKTIVLFTSTGQKAMEVVVKADQTAFNISTTGLPNGLYLVRVKATNQSVFAGKLIIQH